MDIHQIKRLKLSNDIQIQYDITNSQYVNISMRQQEKGSFKVEIVINKIDQEFVFLQVNVITVFSFFTTEFTNIYKSLLNIQKFKYNAYILKYKY